MANTPNLMLSVKTHFNIVKGMCMVYNGEKGVGAKPSPSFLLVSYN
jgi:hypothetical protein